MLVTYLYGRYLKIIIIRNNYQSISSKFRTPRKIFLGFNSLISVRSGLAQKPDLYGFTASMAFVATFPVLFNKSVIPDLRVLSISRRRVIHRCQKNLYL